MKSPSPRQAPPLFDISGKRILITGSNGGLGFGVAQGLAAHGATVILNGRNSAKLKQAADSIRAQGHSVEELRFDATNETEVDAAIKTLADAGIDVLINNAGITRRFPLDQLTLADWNDVINTDLTSAFIVARAVAKLMIPKKRGKIINICSLLSDLGLPARGPYIAAKGGLKMLTKAMCADWARHNLQANAIAPGYFVTDMNRALANDPEFDGWVKKRTPAGRWGKVEDLVGAAVFLSSDASAFVNGHTIYVDGGMTAVL